mmetsp:Transcript_28784/g.63427  ORF Transcript_28784/g.63427 Transcript_28784/m.63427 type:complete len:338 (-) Transcript_28784:496-1509(-)
MARTVSKLLRVAAVGAGAIVTAAGATYIYAAPTYNSLPDYHIRSFGEPESRLLRSVNSLEFLHHQGGSSSDTSVPNPGVRVFEDFLSPKERKALLDEIGPLKMKYGINLINPVHAAIYKFQMGYLTPSPKVNMLRITGRPEAASQSLPPWRYGDHFDEKQLPPRLRQLTQRIRSIPGLRLGKLRDVTLNYRHSHFFRLDPHVDPELDGENVFILGLDSDTVLTLCPLRMWGVMQWLDWLWGALSLEDERQAMQRQTTWRSWTPWDLDVKLPAGTLVLMSGDARWKWTHGTRLGVQVPGLPGLHDWWGEPRSIVQRSPERHSVVLAFAKPEEGGNDVL